ncbi:hypothetical protein K439DRAFT_148276 [Ramaria rubella]|nr:hypothetical protein K439DRAFT_148276 [Ramaria rubella]
MRHFHAPTPYLWTLQASSATCVVWMSYVPLVESKIMAFPMGTRTRLQFLSRPFHVNLHKCTGTHVIQGSQHSKIRILPSGGPAPIRTSKFFNSGPWSTSVFAF